MERIEWKITEQESQQEMVSGDGRWHITKNQKGNQEPSFYLSNYDLLLSPHGSGTDYKQCFESFIADCDAFIEKIKAEGERSPYYVDVDGDGTVTDAEISEAVFALLSPSTNQFDNAYHNFEPDMSADDFYDFMVWHRGLAVPRARNLNDERVQKGKSLFAKMGCAACHRPSWTTGDDNYWAPAMNGTQPLPRYKDQKIWPYSDFIQHRLYMKNDIHGTWCRTTPLWGRGLSTQNTGRSDRLHDCRARNVLEAIMWHGFSKQSDAYPSTEQFYNLSKEDRDAVIMFIESI